MIPLQSSLYYFYCCYVSLYVSYADFVLCVQHPGVDADYVSVFDCCFSLITVIVNMSMCHLMLMLERLIVVVASSSVFE